MLRFSLSGVLLLFDVAQSSAALSNPKSLACFAATLVVAFVTVLPEVSRLANAFVAGELFGETPAQPPNSSE